jgi:transposase, IS5 family
MLDATVIQAASAENRPSNDPDVSRSARQEWFDLRYKAHLGVDEGSGLIRAVLTRPVNVNDTTPADDLIRGDKAVCVLMLPVTPTPDGLG